MCEIINKDTHNEDNLAYAEMKHFAQCSNLLLESFILARRTDYQVKIRLPKKGKLADAKNSECNMICIAFESKANKNLIKK